ncbi:MAG: nucleotidyltransferase, partial [Anaerolineales bacterium]
MSNNLAVVGCYYFPEAEELLSAIEEQINRKIALKGEYYLVDAINILLNRGLEMHIEKVDVWLDAGTPEALLDTNRYLLEHGRENSQTITDLDNSVIIPPVFIHPSARVSSSTIGPHVSIGENSVIQRSAIKDTIVSAGTHITNSILETSLLGHNVTINGLVGKLNLGDDSWAAR